MNERNPESFGDTRIEQGIRTNRGGHTPFRRTSSIERSDHAVMHDTVITMRPSIIIAAITLPLSSARWYARGFILILEKVDEE